MPKHPSDLLLLLEYAFGQTSIQSRQHMADRLKMESSLNKKLDCVWLAERSESLSFSSIQPEVIATFLEGNLKEKGVRLFEERCWKSKRLLKEVISAYKFVHADKAAHDNSETYEISADQESKLMEWAGLPDGRKDAKLTSPPIEKKPVDPQLSPTKKRNQYETIEIDSSQSPTVEIKKPVLSNPSPSILTKNNGRHRLWIAVAAVFAGLIATGTFFWVNQGEDIQNQAVENQPVKPDSDGKQLPKANRTQESPSDHDLVEQAPSDVHTDPEKGNQQNKEIVSPSDPVPPTKEVDTPTQLVEKPEKSTEPDKVVVQNESENNLPIAAKVTWPVRTRGVIIARSATGDWKGLHAIESEDQPIEFRALDDSWIQLRVETIGRVNLLPNSHLRISRSKTREAITFDLQEGEMVFLDLDDSSQLELQHHYYKLDAFPEAKEITLLVRQTHRAFQTYVAQGAMRIEVQDGTAIHDFSRARRATSPLSSTPALLGIGIHLMDQTKLRT